MTLTLSPIPVYSWTRRGPRSCGTKDYSRCGRKGSWEVL
ncbi:hypothetical protein FQN60_005139 [Etheostoma spectabile]|uniref:Uncharacterized protein n=1 Tax=Etheostoma spectabile TaxID=54343 RepID=A0A5J5DLQ8_9PERO|nr:hypothetical protein FQN60_005139 [Etheostoma spectabile]